VTAVEVEVPDADAMRALGRRLAQVLRPGDLVLLTGPLGAGKTTLASGVGAGLDVQGRVTSPTFVLAREHPPRADGPTLVHVDAYRLGGALELETLDLESALAESVTLVEWGTGLVEDLAPDRLEVLLARPEGDEAGSASDLADPGDEPRVVTVRGVGDRWAAVDLAAVTRGGD
jgi:tRNA threonylcarbamoyladenosine biosynthesis protein TsaE